jgi:glycosyltransferase involved in cell wall biosynthesis
MRQKIIVRAPILSQSGYGEHARFVLRALKTREDIFDLYIDNLHWGQTSWLWEDDDERQWIDQLLMKTIEYAQSGGVFDVSLQVTIPNEWQKMAPVNIGCTAGIETTKISSKWVESSYLMDKIIVVSDFARQGFVNTVYEFINQKTNERGTIKAKEPVEVVNFCFNEISPKPIELDLKHDFNFLAVAQFSPRKNMENTLRWFLEEFFDQEVGLIIKASIANNSHADFVHTKSMIRNLLKDPAYADRACSVHLIHGYLSEEEMAGLYSHDKVKALINISHGEGFGLPIFKAAAHGKPIVTVPWGGQTDFLYVPEKVKGSKKRKLMPKFAPVNYTIQQVQKEAVWKDVLVEDSQWAFADQGSFKMTLRDVYKKYAVYQRRAADLQKYIRNKFTPENQYKQFTDIVADGLNIVADTEVDEMFSKLFK